MMRDIIYSLPDQISAAIKLVPDRPHTGKTYDRLLVCGMGGSGISGDILAAMYPQIPVMSNKDYTIPAFVDKRTLAILVSYSGNTEETLSSYRLLSKRGIDMILVSSGGKLLKKKASSKIKVPQGLPPRGALGYLFTPLPILIHQAGLIRTDPRKEMLRLVTFLNKNRDGIEREARRMAGRFVDKLIIMYADSASFVPVVNRWRCQFNENSKVLAHFNVIPEMNHNEIVGLGNPEKFNEDTILVFLNDPMAHRRNRIRQRLLKSLIKKEIGDILEVHAKGTSALQHIFYTIMLGDLISYYLALRLGVDPMPVARIEQFKKKLSEFK